MDETTTVHEVPLGVAVPVVPGYRVTRWVGQGSTAHVWRARRESDDALVALKVLDVAAEEAAVREHTVLAESAVEHTVPLHECLTAEGDGRTVLVLDWMAGGSLRDVLRARGSLSVGETVTVLSPLATALGQLHRLGVVHGDVSTGNILLDSTGRPVWSDLGCSRLVGVDPSEADLWGTDGFVAPEVALGRPPSVAGDVYGLGAVAWACLTGAAPGHRATRPDLATVAPGAPAALLEIVEACLDPDPEQRPDVDDVARQVFDAADAEPLTIVVPDDVESTLTRRIREAAVRDTDEVPFWEQEIEEMARPRRWWPRRSSGPPPVEDVRDRSTSPRRDRPSRDRRQGGAHAGAVDRSAARPWVAAVAVIGAAVGLSLFVPWERLAEAEPGTRSSEPTTSASMPASRTAVGVVGELSAARERPTALLTALADERADVLTTQDGEQLEELTVPGSPAAEQDARVLRQLRAGGYRYSGLGYRVGSVTVARTTGRHEVVLQARIGTTSYTVHGDGRQVRPAQSGEVVEVRLAHQGGRWRIAEISAP